MAAWKRDELTSIGTAEEVEIAARRSDGVLRKPVTVWLVRAGDDIYVRSAVRGHSAAWFSGVRATHRGRIWAGGIEKDVSFEEDTSDNDAVDAAYRTKYSRYRGRILNTCLTPEARSTTIRIVPAT